MGRGVREGTREDGQGGTPTPAPAVAAAMGLASAGFVRSNLYVLRGGAGGNTATAYAEPHDHAHAHEDLSPTAIGRADVVDERLEAIRIARQKGFEGDPCGECGNMTLVRNGTCLKCVTCGSTSGCS